MGRPIKENKMGHHSKNGYQIRGVTKLKGVETFCTIESQMSNRRFLCVDADNLDVREICTLSNGTLGGGGYIVPANDNELIINVHIDGITDPKAAMKISQYRVTTYDGKSYVYTQDGSTPVAGSGEASLAGDEGYSPKANVVIVPNSFAINSASFSTNVFPIGGGFKPSTSYELKFSAPDAVDASFDDLTLVDAMFDGGGLLIPAKVETAIIAAMSYGGAGYSGSVSLSFPDGTAAALTFGNFGTITSVSLGAVVGTWASGDKFAITVPPVVVNKPVVTAMSNAGGELASITVSSTGHGYLMAPYYQFELAP